MNLKSFGGKRVKEIEYNGNIFMLPKINERAACLVTTNGIVKQNGCAVMGAGIAKYCRDKFAGVDRELGIKISASGNHVYRLGYQSEPDSNGIFLLYSFPTKDDWKEDSKLELIRQSCREMMKKVKDDYLDVVYMPCPGCSNGKLDYWKDVRPILINELNDKFVVCIPSIIMKKR